MSYSEFKISPRRRSASVGASFALCFIHEGLPDAARPCVGTLAGAEEDLRPLQTRGRESIWEALSLPVTPLCQRAARLLCADHVGEK